MDLPELEPLEELADSTEETQCSLALPVGATIEGEKPILLLRKVLETARTSAYEGCDPGGSDPIYYVRQALTAEGSRSIAKEANVAAELDLPWIRKPLSLLESQGQMVCVEPLSAREPSLESLINGLSAPFESVLSVMVQLAYAIARVHEKGWVHGALRPSVVQLGRPIGVMGLENATRIGQKSEYPAFFPGYSAPEVFGGDSLDGRADIYSIGAMLFHALEGRPLPEQGADLGWTPKMPVPGVPQILSRCLCDRVGRYQSASELHADLKRLAKSLSNRPKYSVFSATSIGLNPSRNTNEDSHACLTFVCETDEGQVPIAVVAVSDGMGGMDAGEVASSAAIRAVVAEAAKFIASRTGQDTDIGDQVRAWVEQANFRVCEDLAAIGARGGATLSVALAVGTKLVFAHVGDTRICLWRAGKLMQLSQDHSVVASLVQQGMVSVEEARTHPDRNKLTRSLGERRSLPDYYIQAQAISDGTNQLILQDRDVVVLMSDGLWEPVSEVEISAAIEIDRADLQQACERLIGLTLLRGAPDNVTLAMLDVRFSGLQKEECKDGESGMPPSSGLSEVGGDESPETVRNAQGDTEG